MQMPHAETLPAVIRDVATLEEVMSRPTREAVEAIAAIDGDILLLGVGGKMGPTLARMAVRAAKAARVDRRVIGASRFSEPGLEERLRAGGVETIRCDVLDPVQVEKLPAAKNVVAMTGMKFGSTGRPDLTWAMNAYAPAVICRRFFASRIVAFSTGNVYPLTAVTLGGSKESDAVGPVGEYAMTAVGRERMYEYFSRTLGIPTAILRLNYAQDLRYGVMADLARKVWHGEPIDLAMGNFNAIWQGDANAMALAAFAHASVPPFVVNLAGPETLSVRRVGEEFGRLLGKTPQFEGHESGDALLSNGQLGHRLFGYPRVPVEAMIAWIADWVRRGGETLGKPTHFEVRDGKF